MYTPNFGGREDLMIPRVLLRESVMDLPGEEAATLFVAAVDLKVRETLDYMWYGFRVGIARNFVFAAAGMLTLADQLEALVNPDYIY